LSDLKYKLGIVDEVAAVMKLKLIEKEPRASWREHPMELRDIEAWLRHEVDELLTAPPGEEMREAADVANMAAIFADVKRRARR
jgi:hypothetical protein